MKVTDQQQDFGGGMVDNVPPDRIPQNAYAFGENWECRNAILRTRRGQKVVSEGVAVGSLGPWTPVGSCRIVSELGVEHVIVAMVGAVNGTLKTLAVNPFLSVFQELSFAAGTVLTPGTGSVSALDAVTLFQYGRYVYMFRRNMAKVYRLPVSLASTEWAEVATAAGSGEWVPRSAAACVAYGRVWAAVKSSDDDDVYDAVAASDITMLDDALAWDMVRHHWQVGADDHSDIMAMVPHSAGKIIVFKRHSVYALNGCEGYIDALYVEKLEGKHGAVGGMAAVKVGSDVWYLSDDGVRSVAADVNNNARAVEMPMSQSIGTFFAEKIVMSTTRRFQCSAVVYDSYALFTVPYGHNTPNAVLVYDLVQGCWAGVWSGMFAQQMQVMSHGTSRVLLGFETNGAVQQLLTEDRWGQDDAPTAHLITRAFNCGSTERRKSFRGGLVGVSSGGAVYSLGAVDLDTQDETPIDEGVSVVSSGWMIWIPDDGIEIPDEGIFLTDVGQQRRKFFVGQQARALSLSFRVDSGALDLRSMAVEASTGRMMSEF